MLLEQCLPFTVLKLRYGSTSFEFLVIVGTVLIVYGIETTYQAFLNLRFLGWNSAYRLRY